MCDVVVSDDVVNLLLYLVTTTPNRIRRLAVAAPVAAAISKTMINMENLKTGTLHRKVMDDDTDLGTF